MAALVIEWSLRITLLALGTGAVLTLLRVRSAAARHRAWTAVLLAMLLLPAWAAWGPRIPLAADEVVSIVLPEPVPQTTRPAPAVPSAPAAPPAPALPQPPGPAPWIAAVYFLIAAALLARLLAATLWTRSLQRQTRRIDGVLTSPACSAPITIGWLRPVMLLPEHWTGWTERQREAVLLHEQEHVRRRDPLIRWLSLLNRALFWFHPLAWWLERKLAVLAEEACDEAVLARGHAPDEYARYLIDIARSVEQAGSRLRLHVAFGDTAALTRRVRRILRMPPAPALSRARAFGAISLSAAVFIGSLACTQAQPSMADLRDKRAKAGQAEQERLQALRAEAKAMTLEQAQAVENGLKSKPDDRETHRKVMLYYQQHSDLAGLNALSLWYIETPPTPASTTQSLTPPGTAPATNAAATCGSPIYGNPESVRRCIAGRRFF